MLQYFFTIRRRVRRRRRAPNKAAFETHKDAAKILALQKLELFNKVYNFTYKKVFIKNHTSRWGSCSKLGNINFNYKIALLPDHLTNYVIVHELCHLGQFNHSKAFWELVAKTVPNFRECRMELRHHRA